jgi:hypothetical protein
VISIGVGGKWLQVTPYIGVGGVWKQVTGYWIGVGGAWKNIAILPMNVSVSPTSASGTGVYTPPATRPSVTTGSVTVSVAGGSGTFTYAWAVSFVNGGSVNSSGSCSANAPTSATTTFTGQSCDGADSPGSDYYAAVCTVTDTVTGQVGSVSVPIKLSNTYLNPH